MQIRSIFLVIDAVNKIVEFFTELGKIVSSVIQHVIDFFAGLLEFTTSLPEYIELVYDYINILPTSIKAVAVMTVSACLIFLVIGRRGT